jgi:hypothetical protein
MLLMHFWLPGIAAAAALLAVPLSNAMPGTFFFGTENLVETARSIVRLSVQHHPTWWTGTMLAAWTETALMWIALGVAIAASCGAVLRLLRSQRSLPGSPAGHPLLLSGGTLACTIALLMVAHTGLGMPYPKERTGLYFVPLVVLTLAGAAEWARPRAVRLSALGVLAVLTMTAVEQFTLGSYGQWRYDASSRQIAELISSRAADRSRPMRVAATEHLYQPALEFYRVTRFPDRLASVADGFDPASADHFDLVVVNAQDAVRVADRCRQIYVNAVSGAEVRECDREAATDDSRAIATTGDNRGAR